VLLFENARNHYDEIKEWYPVWYREIFDMDALWQVYGGKFDEMRNDILRAIDNNFIDYADTATISRWEEKLKIVHDSPRTLQERRNVIKAHIVGHGRIGQQEIKDIVLMFTDGEVSVSFDLGVITIIVRRDIRNIVRFNYADVKRILEERIPAHLSFSLVLSEIITTDYHAAIASDSIHEHITTEDPVPPPEPGLPPPTLSIPSGTYFLGINVSVIRPDDFPDMDVYYFIDGDRSRPFFYTEDSPWAVADDRSFMLFGMADGEISRSVTYNYTIEQPHFKGTITLKHDDFVLSGEITELKQNPAIKADLNMVLDYTDSDFIVSGEVDTLLT